MTAHEVAGFIVQRWMMDHCPTAIMLQLICRGYPARKGDVLAVIRRYIDHQTENRAPAAGWIPQ